MNNYFMLKKMVASVILCCMMLSGGCTVISGLTGLARYSNNNDKGAYKKESWLLGSVAMGASVDYLWYNQAQKYQAQGQTKGGSYVSGGLVTLGYMMVAGIVLFAIATYYGGGV